MKVAPGDIFAHRLRILTNWSKRNRKRISARRSRKTWQKLPLISKITQSSLNSDMFWCDWNTLDWTPIKLLRNYLGLYSALLEATIHHTSAQRLTQHLTRLICCLSHTQKLTCEIGGLFKSKVGMFFQWNNCSDEVQRKHFCHPTLQTMKTS